MKLSVIVIATVVLSVTALSADNWPSFRGPAASGIASGPPAPISWDVPAGKAMQFCLPHRVSSACSVQLKEPPVKKSK